MPVGKLRNDRYVPLHPTLVELIGDWRNANAAHIARTGRLLTDGVSNVDRHRVSRMVRRIANNADIGHVHPHQLRHTLATQAINRGMRLEAVAALLGHKNLEMTMVYARIADETVADEYFDVAGQVDQLYAHRQHQGPSMAFDPDTPTPIELTRAEALVLFDWLGRHEHANTTPGDPIEQRAFGNLSAILERTLVEPSQSDYNDIFQAARTHHNDSSPT